MVLHPAAEPDTYLSFSLLHQHQTCKELTRTINMEEPIVSLGGAVCRQSHRYKTSIKTTWKSSEAFGKSLLQGSMCALERQMVITETLCCQRLMEI